MFDQLYTLADGQCVYQGSTKQLVPFLSTLGLECPSYHNPASYVIEVACGEHGDHTRKLVDAIDNGKRDIRSAVDYEGLKMRNDLVKVHNLKAILDKNATNANNGKYEENLTLNNGILNGNLVNDIVKSSNVSGAGSSAAPVVSTNEKGDAMIDVEKADNCTTALLSEEITSPERYPTSQFHQFWVVLRRTLLFSYRDWVSARCTCILLGVHGCFSNCLLVCSCRPLCTCVYLLICWLASLLVLSTTISAMMARKC